ncbi:MAG: diguanylate cyclase, partial [Myxococcales bacterium]|nr:diguanylate cyclase [Myxococcales bacterium]
LARALQGETLRQLELFVRPRASKDGRWHSVNAVPLRDPRGKVRGGVAVSRDVTELKAMQLELQHLSLVDELTGLHNRRAFMTLAEHQLKIAARTRRFAALLFVDLDDFKVINDSLGHPTGDLALQAAAGVLRESFRASDIIARLGGDEFVILAIEVDAPSVEVMRERVYRNVEAWNARRSIPYRLAMSVGICVCDPARGQSLADLAVIADAKMYEEKARRRSKRGT